MSISMFPLVVKRIFLVVWTCQFINFFIAQCCGAYGIATKNRGCVRYLLIMFVSTLPVLRRRQLFLFGRGDEQAKKDICQGIDDKGDT